MRGQGWSLCSSGFQRHPLGSCPWSIPPPVIRVPRSTFSGTRHTPAAGPSSGMKALLLTHHLVPFSPLLRSGCFNLQERSMWAESSSPLSSPHSGAPQTDSTSEKFLCPQRRCTAQAAREAPFQLPQFQWT